MKKNTFTATIASLLKNKNNSNPLKVSSLKSLLILLLFLVGIGNTISAQCIIGTGTTTTNGGGTGSSLTADPVECYYNFEHFQIVYTAAELSAGGMTSGAVINSMGFSISEVPGSVTLASYTIKMGHTNQLLASPAITSGLTTVKTAFTYTPTLQTAGNFDMITFSTNFTWNGTSNVVLDICTGSNAFTLPYGGLRYTAVATSPTYYLRQDNTTSCGVSVTTTANNRPNIRFNFTNPITYTSIVANGDWNTAATWSLSTGGNGVPTAGSTVIVNTNVTAATTPTNQPLNITVNSGSTLSLNAAYTNPSGSTVTVASGGTLAVGATYTNTGTTTVTGTFQINNGGWATGAGTWTYTSTTGTLAFGNTGSNYTINSGDVFWPNTSSGPYNVTVSGNGGINLGAARTVPSAGTTGIFQTAAQVTGSAVTCTGTCQINAGGYFSTTPTYGASSTLIYATGNTSGSPYGVGTEWTGSAAAAGVGIPNNVTIQGNTFITMPNGNRGMSGALNVTAGSGITLNGTSGDLGIGGNFTQNGTLTHSGRAINFFGTTATTQTISGTGLNSTGATNCFAYFLNNTTSTGGVTIGVNTTIDGSANDVLQLLNAGPLKIGAFTLTVNGNGGNILVSGSSRVIDFTSASGILLIKGTTGTLKTVTTASSGLLSITSTVPGGQVQVQGGGLNCGSSLTTIGSGAYMTINSNGYIATNSPTYATGSTLSFRTGGAYGVGSGDKTWGIGTSGAGVPDKVEVNAASTNVTISEDRTARTSVTVTSGTLTNNTNTLSISTGTSAASAVVINGGTYNNGGGTTTIGNSLTTTSTNALTVSSGTLTNSSGTINVVNTGTTASSAVLISGGTYNNSGGTMNIGNASTTSAATGALTISSGALTNSSGTITIAALNTTASATVVNITGSGTLTNSGGTLNVGPTNGGNQSLTLGGGTLTINNGTVAVNGTVVLATGVFNMSSGNLNIDANSGVAGSSAGATADILGIASAVTGTVNGGTILINDPLFAGTTGRALAYTGTAASRTWAGNTVQFGGSTGNASTSTNGFNVDTYVNSVNLQLGNVIANGGAVVGTSRFVSGSVAVGNGFDIGGNLTINASSEVRTIAAGTVLRIKGNIVNNGILTDITGIAFNQRSGGTISSNTAAQTVSGSGTFQNLTSSATAKFTNLTFDNTTSGSAITFSIGDVTLTGTATLTNGIIDIGNNNSFNFVTTASAVARTNGYVLIQGTGQMKKDLASGATSFTFHVGENTGTTEYSPYSLSFSANSLARTIGVRPIDANHPNLNDVDTQTDYISRYWQLSNSAAGTYTYTATATYVSADIVGTETEIKMGLWNGTSPWKQAVSSAASNVLTISTALSETTGPLSATADFTGRVKGAIFYTWVGATDALWTTSTNWSPNGVPGASDNVVLANGTTNLNLTTAVTVKNITFAGTGTFFTVGSAGAITATGTITYTSGSGSWNSASTFTISSSSSQTIPPFTYGNLNCTGGNRVWTESATTGIAGTFTPGTGTYTATSGSTVDYNGTGAQTIGSVNYYNLTNSGNGARTLVTGTIDVANSYTPTTATTTPGTANVFNFSSASAQTIPASSYARITNTGNGNRTLANSGTITIAGPLFTPGSGTYTVTGSTVALTSTTGFNLTLPTVSSGNSFNVLTINGTGTFALPYAATTQNLANTLNIQAGTFVTNPTSNTTALVNNIAVGTINLSGGTLDDLSTGGVVTTTNLLISTAWNQTGGTATVSGSGYGKIIFSGGGASTFAGTSTTASFIWWIVQLSDNTTLTSSTDLLLNFNPTTTITSLTVDLGSTLNMGINLVKTNRTNNIYAINGTFKTSNTNGFSGSTTTALNSTNNPTITLGANSTVEYTNASATQTVTNRTDYANLTLTGLSKTIGATALTLSKNLTINSGATYNGAANPALTIGGNFLNSGTFTQGTGLLTFNGTSPQTVGGDTASTFNNVTVSGAGGGLSLGNSQTINGTLTLSASSGGNIDLNGSNNVTLGATATLTGETCSRQFINSGSPTQGNGYVQTTRTLAANPGNVASLGLNIQTATALGSTNLKRFEKAISSVGTSNSIARVYSITPTTAASGNVTLTSSYCDGELNSNAESALITYYGTGTNETTGYSSVYATASNDATANSVTTPTTASLIAGQNNITLANAGSDAYYTVQDGDWNTAATWVLNAVPPAGVATIIKNAVVVNGTVTNASSSITINTGKSLTFGASGTITTTTLTNNGSVVMTSGGTLTIANGGTFANGTNTFTGGSGTVIFAGTGTITGTTTFNNVTINNGVDFGVSSTIGATGTLQLNSGGYASNSNSPLFASGSTLKYNAGGGSGSKYNQSFEWPANNGPSNVVVDNDSWVQLTANRSLAGNLTVTNGALQSLGANTLTLNGTSQTATISESSGGAIYGTDNGFGNDLSLVISSGTTTLTGDATSSLDDAKKFINVTVNSGATLALSRGILCKYGAFALNGTLQINANGYVQNDTSYGSNAKLPAYNSTTGALTYNNGGPYTNGGEWLSTNSPFNVTIQNNSAVVLSGDRTINGTLTLTAGTLELGTKNLTIGETGTITASSPSASTMIIASGSGQLRKTFSTTGSFTYPIGDNTGTAEYSPVTLNFTAGTLAGYAGVNVTNAKQTNNTSTTDYINRYWTVATSGITSPTCTASFVYLDADIVGTESNLYGGRYLSSTWNCMDAVTTATNTISKVITAFGDFTAGEASVFGCCVNPTSGGTIAVAQTICSGTAPTAFTSSALPSGQSGTLEYKWQSSTTSSSSGFSDISGATATTYSPGILTATTWFKRLSKVTCSDTWSANSNVVTITVNSLPTVSIASNNSPVCSGAASFSLTGTTDAVVTYSINGGTNATTTLTGGAATISVPNPFASQVLTLVSVANNGCTSSLSDTSTVSISTTTYDGTSWSNGDPDSSKLAIFTGNYTIAADLTACSLRVTNNAVVTVNSTYNVNLNGAITVDSGSSFTMNNNTNLLQSDASAVNTGNIIVKRNTSTIVRLDHTLWSSPVTGQNLFSFSPNTLVNRFYVYNTATNSYVTTGLSNTSLFTPAKGFAVRAPNNQSATTPAVWTGTFTGVPNNGTKTFTLATNAANGYNYNLVGNPYPSAISASNFYAANASKIGGTLYFYAHTLTMNASGIFPTGTNYATWTGLGGAAATAGDGHTPAVAPNGIIQVGQGFIVRATASGDVTFTNAMRVANQQNQFMKAATASAETHRMWLNLKTDTGVDVNQILVGYMDGATQGVDAGLDGLSFGNTGSYLYSKIENDNFVIQARSLPFDVTDEVPLGFNCATAGSYSISLTNTDGLFAADQDILVRDNLTGTDTSIKTVPYTFNSETGVFDTRFRLVYTQALGVPSTNFTENSVIVYKNTDWFHVNTKGIEMKDIMVYDISGRLIYSKKEINATTAVLNGLTTTNQVLILKINSIEDKTVTIKVIN